MWKQAATGVAAIAASLALTAPAQADPQGYLQYLRDHGFTTIMTDLNSDPAVQLHAGHQACQDLHDGIEPGILHTRWGSYPLIVEAAQHELCPDTLH
jgi:hypothetical protein